MKSDIRIENNKSNIENLKKLLMDICKTPNKFDKCFFEDSLKSQGGLSKIEIPERNITKSSINTLKRISPLVLSGGFEELDKIRIMAYETLYKKDTNQDKQESNTKIGLNNRIKELELQLIESKKSQLFLINALNEDLKSFNQIKRSTTIKLSESFANNSIKRISAFSLLSPDFMTICDSQENVFNINRKPNE
jgi:hypothetical protein